MKGLLWQQYAALTGWMAVRYSCDIMAVKPNQDDTENDQLDNGPGLTFGDLVWRVFGQRAVRMPGECLVFLLALVATWAMVGTTGLLQVILAGVAALALIVGVIGFFMHRCRFTQAAKVPLRRSFEITNFEPDRWRVVLRLSRRGAFLANGFIRLKKNSDPCKYRHYSHLESFLLGLDGKDQYAKRIDTQGQPYVRLWTKDTRTGEIQEQVELTFHWSDDVEPSRVEIEIGYDMPAEDRKPLLERVTEKLESLDAVKRITSD